MQTKQKKKLHNRFIASFLPIKYPLTFRLSLYFIASTGVNLCSFEHLKMLELLRININAINKTTQALDEHIFVCCFALNMYDFIQHATGEYSL